MLEPHPPHHAVSSWREFLVHIATIVIGLLIAVGIEQSVEWIHHQNEIAETREALEHERQLNARLSVVITKEWRRFTPKLQTDLAVLEYIRQHPGAPKANWPGELSFVDLQTSYLDSAWQTAQTDAVLKLMPQPEVRRYIELYKRLHEFNDTYALLSQKLREVVVFAISDPDPARMSQEELIRVTSALREVISIQHARGRLLLNLSVRFPDFVAPAVIENRSLYKLKPNPADLAEAEALWTQARRIKDEADIAR